MFGSIETLRQSVQSPVKCHSQSTLSETLEEEKFLNAEINDFSIKYFTSNNKLCTKLSKATKCTLNSQSLDSDSNDDNSDEAFITFDSKNQQCSPYFNRMYCQQGNSCMFSHDANNHHSNNNTSSSLSLFQLLQEYPQLALIRGRQREYSMFFN